MAEQEACVDGKICGGTKIAGGLEDDDTDIFAAQRPYAEAGSAIDRLRADVHLVDHLLQLTKCTALVAGITRMRDEAGHTSTCSVPTR
jgi:hypothetical protein